MLVKSKKDYVENSRGNRVGIYGPLVDQGSMPYGGWGSSALINGSTVYLNGKSPEEVVIAFQTILNFNKIKFTMNEVWTTLNLDWLRRTPVTGQKVPYAALVRQCEASQDSEPLRGKMEAARWFPKAVDFIGFYLAINKDNYKYDDFARVVKILTDMASLSTCVRLGDHRLHSTLLARLTDIRYRPIHLLTEARTWFVAMLNSLSEHTNTKTTDLSSVATKYNWNNETTN